MMKSFTLAALTIALTAPCFGCSGQTTVGESAPGLVVLSVESLDFGKVGCGEAPMARTVTLTNSGGIALRWKASIDSNAFFDITGDHQGEIAPGAQGNITISAREMPTVVDAGALMHASVLVNTNDVSRSQINIPIQATAVGATFDLVTPSVADFGTAPVGEAAPDIAVTLKNRGNLAAKVAVAPPANAQFTFSWAGGADAVEVKPGATFDGLIAHFKPTTQSPSASAGIVTVTGPVCGKSATAVPVKGQGLAGAVGLSPGTLDFGKVDCQTTATPAPVVLFNKGNAPFTWSASLKAGKNFTISPSAGALVAGTAIEIFVTPKPLGLTTNLADNGFGDSLTITTTASGDAPHVVAIKETANGAILSWPVAPLTYGTQNLFVPSVGKPLTITNDGNAAVAVKVKTSSAYLATPASGSVAATGGTLKTQIAFSPDNFGTVKGTIELTTDDPICQPLPAKVDAIGDGGKASALTISVGGYGQLNRNIASSGGCAILAGSGGRVACWGTNEFGQLGTLKTTNGYNVVPKLKDIVSVAAGGDFNCAADKNGDVWCWGNNLSRNLQIVGKLGESIDKQTEVPVQVSVTDATQVAIGHNVACALTKAGTITCWGDNRRGQITGTNGGFNTFTQQIQNVAGATAVSMNGGGGCALLMDMTVKCWGRFENGQIGNGSSCCGPTQAMPVSSLGNALAITNLTSGPRGGGRIALRADGTVVAWGNQCQGQMGNGSSCRRCAQSTPGVVSGISTATAVAGYYNGGCALLADNTVMCWGGNKFGQVGDGTTTQRTTPVFVTGISDASAIAAGGRGACAIVTGGSIKCWGYFGVSSSVTPQTLKGF